MMAYDRFGRFIHKGPDDPPSSPGRIVGICASDGRVFLATEGHVYELIDGMWHRMVFAEHMQPVVAAKSPTDAA
jgi:hypothetical protein